MLVASVSPPPPPAPRHHHLLLRSGFVFPFGRHFVFAFGGNVGFGFAGLEVFARFLRRLAGRLFGRVGFLDFHPGAHHAGPDQRREGAAHHRPARVERLHRRRRIGVADPDAGRHFIGDAAAEPGIDVFLGGAGLAPLAFGADLGVGAGAAGDDGFEDALRLFGGAFLDHLLVQGVVVAALDRVAFLVGHLGVGDRAVAGARRQGAADPVAVVADRRVSVGPADRRDAVLEPAEHHRRVGRDRVGVARLVDRLGDRAGPVLDRLSFQAFERERGVDRVIRVGRRADDRAGAEVAVLVVVRREDFLALLAEVEVRCAEG